MHPVENSLWKRLRTCRKADYRMNKYINKFYYNEINAYIDLCSSTLCSDKKTTHTVISIALHIIKINQRI
jgi:hypothetical protein